MSGGVSPPESILTVIDKKVLIVRFFVYFKLQNNYRGDKNADKV